MPIFDEGDRDGDGIPNGEDDDIDGDGILNKDDNDMDGDGIPNGEDDDIDGDGIPNSLDDTPFGAKGSMSQDLPPASSASSFSYSFFASFRDDQPTAFPSDVNPYSNEGRAVRFLLARGILELFPDGTFRGDTLLTRAEAARMIQLAAGYSIFPVRNDSVFPDLQPGSKEELYAMSAVAHAIMQGYPDGTFRPLGIVNHAEFVRMLTHAFHLEQNLPHPYRDVYLCAWYAPYVGIADKYDFFLYEQDYFTPWLPMIRREAAWAVYQVLIGKSSGISLDVH